MSVPVELLLQSPIFACGGSEARAALAAASTLRTLGTHQLLFASGDPAERVFLLVEGVVRLFYVEDRRELTMNNLLPPCTFGEVEVFAEAMGGEVCGYLACASAIKPVTVVEMPRAAFLAFFAVEGRATHLLLADICARFRNTASRERAAFADIPTRLASFILVHGDFAGRVVADGVELRVPMRRDDMAHGIGATRRSIARVLRDWKAKKWISLRRGRLIVHDTAALDALCGGRRFRLSYHLDVKWPG